MPQVFNALNGEEFIDVVIGKIRAKMEASGEFKRNNTFPWSKVSFAVGVVAYPQQGMDDINPKINISDSTVITDEAGAKVTEPEGESKTTIVSGKVILDTPDKERVESKLPVPTISVGPGGQLVDKLVLKTGLPMKEKGVK